MSCILGKNTKPEVAVRKLLYSMGYRFRLHAKGLPARPDIVLKKYKTVILVHGCFWHLHAKCRDGTIPKTRRDFWEEKLLNNKRRDVKNVRELRLMGWKVLRVWECEVEKNIFLVQKKLESVLLRDNAGVKS